MSFGDTVLVVFYWLFFFLFLFPHRTYIFFGSLLELHLTVFKTYLLKFYIQYSWIMSDTLSSLERRLRASQIIFSMNVVVVLNSGIKRVGCSYYLQLYN